MQLNFQNLYALVISVGIASLVYGGSLFNSNLISALILTIIGGFLTFYGFNGWYKKQKNEEKLVELEVGRKNATLDFDVKEIDGENDVDYQPDDFDEAGQPINFKHYNIVELKIKLMVFNPCEIKNIVRDIEVSIEQNKKSTKLKKDDFLPIKIDPGEYVPINVKLYQFDFCGKVNDKITVKIFTIDNKEVTKEKIIKYYSKGRELKELTGEI